MKLDREIDNIISVLKEKRGLDFSGYYPFMIKRRIENRLPAARCSDLEEYLEYIADFPDELNHLIDALTINVSRFFRDTLSFEFMAKQVLPAILHRKSRSRDMSFRIWSAGCATGEEPYTIAILIDELMKKERVHLNLNIFATDIDHSALEKARQGMYSFESIKNMKYHFVKHYFTIENDGFRLNRQIRKMVAFSFYDLLDKRTYSPPESVFGNFDLILCRNVLIYYQQEHQKRVFAKLLKSLSIGGYLVLGETEMPPPGFRRKLYQTRHKYHIYKKDELSRETWS